MSGSTTLSTRAEDAPAPSSTTVVSRAVSKRPVLLRYGIVFLLVLGGYLLLTLIAQPNPTGDEPSYLLIAESIAHDGDISLANNYANAHELHIAFPTGTQLALGGHAAVYHAGGPLVPIHGLGLPLLLSPLMALGGGWLSARILMACLAALIAPLVLLIVDRLFPRRPGLNAVTATVVLLTAPAFAYAGQIYPDAVGALLTTLSVALLVRAPNRPRFLAAATAAAAVLPWFHVRFLALTAGLVVALLIVAWNRAGSGAPTGRRWVRVAAVLAPLAISGFGLMAYQQVLYGSPFPTAAYRAPQFPALSPFTVKDFYWWTVGDYLSPGFGVVVLAPISLLVFVGAIVIVRRWGWWGALGLLPPLGYYVTSSALANVGGYCPPGRWLVAISPLFVITLVAAMDHSWGMRVVFTILAPYSLLVSIVIIPNFSDVYRGTDTSMIPVAHWFGPAFPVTRDLRQAGFAFPADQLYHQVGQAQAGGEVIATASDGAGALIYGPGYAILPGVYDATYTFSSVVGTPGQLVGGVDVLDGSKVVASQGIAVPSSGSGPVQVQVQAYVSGGAVQARVVTNGLATIVAKQVSMSPAIPGSIRPPSIRKTLPLTAVWLGIVGLLVMVSFPRPGPRARPVRPDTDSDD